MHESRLVATAGDTCMNLSQEMNKESSVDRGKQKDNRRDGGVGMKTGIPARPKVSLEKTSSADTPGTVPDYPAASLTVLEIQSLLQTRSAPT